MSRAADARAEPKQIGTAIEDLVIDAVDPLEPAADADAHHDAVATSLLAPETVDIDLLFGGIALVEARTDIELKACKMEVPNGGRRTTAGRWTFKGRDAGQHAVLVNRDAMYLLVVYRETDAGQRAVLGCLIVPAQTVDDLLHGHWRSVDRREGTVAQLSWPHLFERSQLASVHLNATAGDEAADVPASGPVVMDTCPHCGWRPHREDARGRSWCLDCCAITGVSDA